MPLSIAVMASGGGSNFAAICEAIDAGTLDARVALLLSNNPEAGALALAKARGIETKVIAKSVIRSQLGFDAVVSAQPESVVDDMAARLEVDRAFDVQNQQALIKSGAELVVLAGYLSIVGPKTIGSFSGRMINIHPALLPSFGGDGYYGLRVHQAVLDTGCKVSGATVHYVDEGTDTGPIIAQKAVPVYDDDDAKRLAARVLEVEHEILPRAIDDIANRRLAIHGQRVVHVG